MQRDTETQADEDMQSDEDMKRHTESDENMQRDTDDEDMKRHTETVLPWLSLNSLTHVLCQCEWCRSWGMCWQSCRLRYSNKGNVNAACFNFSVVYLTFSLSKPVLVLPSSAPLSLDVTRPAPSRSNPALRRHTLS